MKNIKTESNPSNIIFNITGSIVSIVMGLFFVLYDFSMYDKIRSLADTSELAKHLLIIVPKLYGVGLIVFAIAIIIYSYKLNKKIKDNESRV